MTVRPRLFLLAPEIGASDLLHCVDAAATAADIASIVIPPRLLLQTVEPLQAKGIAVLTTGDPQLAAKHRCDGLHMDAGLDTYRAARTKLGARSIVGAFCAGSRHAAMEMAEAGADYIALAQSTRSAGGEPIVGWWSQTFEIPCVAFEPVPAADLDTLLPQNPDFIRPSDEMWTSPEAARRILSDITARLDR